CSGSLTGGTLTGERAAPAPGTEYGETTPSRVLLCPRGAGRRRAWVSSAWRRNGSPWRTKIWRHAGRVGVSYGDHYAEQGVFRRLVELLGGDHERRGSGPADTKPGVPESPASSVRTHSLRSD